MIFSNDTFPFVMFSLINDTVVDLVTNIRNCYIDFSGNGFDFGNNKWTSYDFHHGVRRGSRQKR